jgi:hypothetical protein
MHESTHGSLDAFRTAVTKVKASVEEPAPLQHGAPTEALCEGLVDTAMGHIDAMKFRYRHTDAEVNRAKTLVKACLAAVQPALGGESGDGVLSSLIDPLMGAFDRISSRRGEAGERRRRSAAEHPPLQAHPRELGVRPASKGKRKCKDGVVAFAYDTCFEEVLCREVHYDPELLVEMIMADQYWLQRAKELKSAPKRAWDRVFQDICDGEVWQQHEVMGDPNYEGPPRLCTEAYGDDVDVPNGIGPAAGHSKLWIQTISLLNRPPSSRTTLRAIWLSTTCLSSDFKIFGPHTIISGKGTTEFSLGATCRRLWTWGSVKIPPVAGVSTFDFRFFCMVFTADGMAMGDICGTNTSFSRAINICNTCEDMDQRSPAKKKPCGFLVCECGDDFTFHKPGCACHFRLKTPARARARPNPSAQERQRLGITNVVPGIQDIPGIHVSRPGPKDTMHTFAEGRSSQLAAVTCWNVVHSGWATADQLKHRASSFDWTPGGKSQGVFTPNYLPKSIFVSTKIDLPDGSKVWGPHKDVSIPGSAAGVRQFVIMSSEFFRPFVPTDQPLPPWFQAWEYHAAAFAMTLRYRFTFGDLLRLEELIVTSEQIISDIPCYSNLWIPKAHWVLHTAHDIFLWGPTRLLSTFIKEMKNGVFKHGAKRGNFHNPPKDVANFWALQSDFELQENAKGRDFRSSCDSSKSAVIVSGAASMFHDSQVVMLLRDNEKVAETTHIEFLSSVAFHGVTLQREEHVLISPAVYIILRIVRVGGNHYLFLEEVSSAVEIDEHGRYYVLPATYVRPLRLLSLTSTSDVCGLWALPLDGSRLYVVPKC